MLADYVTAYLTHQKQTKYILIGAVHFIVGGSFFAYILIKVNQDFNQEECVCMYIIIQIRRGVTQPVIAP